VTLAELIAPERAVVPLRSSEAAAAALELVERLVDAGAVQDPDKLRARVEEERGEDIVAFGDRALVLHYRTDAVRELVVAIGTASTPVRRELGESEAQAARIVLVIVAPPRLAGRYLQVLGAFARALASPAVVDAIVAAPDADALARLPELRGYELPEQLAVRDIMTDQPRTTGPDTPLRDAAYEIANAGITALPVVDEHGTLVGMLSERELIRHLLSNYLQGVSAPRPSGAGANARRSVRDVMTRQVLCVSPEQPLAEVASLLVNKDVDGVPVVREGRVIGFLTRGDLIRKLIPT
jgi:CBS domain-containing protein/mannitol/fructose-specific phosphotransferase system IIA component (Ntr-type)